MDNGNDKRAVGTSDVTDVVHGIGRDVDVRLVYGEPQAVHGRTLIPVAQIRYMGGGGFGGGSGREIDEETHRPTGEGHGLGAGLRVSARPLGIVEFTEERERWIPTLDVNRLIAIWSLVAGAVLIATVRGLFRMLATGRRADTA